MFKIYLYLSYIKRSRGLNAYLNFFTLTERTARRCSRSSEAATSPNKIVRGRHFLTGSFAGSLVRVQFLLQGSINNEATVCFCHTRIYVYANGTNHSDSGACAVGRRHVGANVTHGYSQNRAVSMRANEPRKNNSRCGIRTTPSLYCFSFCWFEC